MGETCSEELIWLVYPIGILSLDSLVVHPYRFYYLLGFFLLIEFLIGDLFLSSYSTQPYMHLSFLGYRMLLDHRRLLLVYSVEHLDILLLYCVLGNRNRTIAYILLLTVGIPFSFSS